MGQKRNDKGWPECNVIVEEGDYDDERGFTWRFQALIALLSFVVLFTVFCLIIWGAARPFKAEVVVKLKKYFQPRKSRGIVSVNLEAFKVPLYGAGSSLVASANGFQVPLTVQFEIRTRGEVVGKLVKTMHRRHISCPLVIDSTSTKPIKFKKNSCTYGLSPLTCWNFCSWLSARTCRDCTVLLPRK